MNTDKLKKCLALMASETDGEALNAARMVVRMLKADGHRPEDLSVRADGFAMPMNDELIETRIRVEAGLRAAELAALDRQTIQKQAKEISDLKDQLEEAKDRLEEALPPLPWAEIAERHSRPGKRSKRIGDGVELRARTGKPTLADRRLLRELHEKDERKKARRAAA